jgi:pyruvate-formate lyase-activating enzyme
VVTPRTLLALVATTGSLAQGMGARVTLQADDRPEAVAEWCERTGNTLVASGPGWVQIRRGRAAAPAPVRRQPAPGSRVWIYTNFDCNLSCDYCCVRSAPGIPRRELGLARIEDIATESAALGADDIFLTGGEPFLLPYIDRVVHACAGAARTTLLTNGMLFRGRRRELLEAMPRDGLALQISLDSPTPDRHDRHRGPGTWRRAREGIEIAAAAGFRVRVAATVGSDEGDESEERREERALHSLLDGIGIPPADRIIRRCARRGRAEDGVVLTVEGLVPEITFTDQGVFWHPVGADDPDMRIAGPETPLPAAVHLIQRRLDSMMAAEAAATATFPCA